MACADEPTADQVAGPIEETFKRTLAALEKKLTAENLGEEGFTSCLLGGLTCMFSEVVRQVPNAKGPIDCSWGSYSKRGVEDPHSEAANGADFCLVVFDDAENVRLAMFQAKRAEKSEKSSVPPSDQAINSGKATFLVDQRVDIHERPKKPANLTALSAWRESQAIILARAASCLAEGKGNPGYVCVKMDETATCVCNSGADVDHTNLHWVHYLIYSDQPPACVPFSRIPEDRFRREAKDGTTSNVVRIDKVDQTTFLDVALTGLRGQELHWIPMKFADLKGRLPTLLAVMRVCVADEKTGGGFASELGAGLDGVVDDITQGRVEPRHAAAPTTTSAPGRRPGA